MQLNQAKRKLGFLEFLFVCIFQYSLCNCIADASYLFDSVDLVVSIRYQHLPVYSNGKSDSIARSMALLSQRC